MDHNPIGLSAQEVLDRQKKFGLNQLSSNAINSRTIFIRQFKSSFIYLLIAAIGISLALGHHLDAIMITLFVSINTLLGFIQEYRSEKTLELLKSYTTPMAKVIRDHQHQTIPTNQLVPDDIVLLQTGDIIPADVRFLSQNDLLINESILTGESAPVTTDHGYSGTTIVKGSATAIVTSTGPNSQLGKISKLATTARKESSFEKGINSYSQFIVKLVIGTLVLLFLANIVIKGNSVQFSELLLFSIALAVSVIPEALPVVVTFSLSKGAAQLAKSKVVVKRLSAIEDLGSIQVLCTDKTGTLTENLLTVNQTHSPQPEATLTLAGLSSFSGTDPFDQAINHQLSKDQLRQINQSTLISEFPFDPQRRRNTRVIKIKNRTIVVVRGALESIIPLCKISPAEKTRLLAAAKADGQQGFRIIALATKTLKAPHPTDIQHLEKDLDFSGYLTFTDPIKPSTFEAIKQAKHLGVSVKILTGDSPEVAGHVAQQINLIPDASQVITGHQFALLSPEDQATTVNKYSVFARVTPEQKYQIIQLLEKTYLVGFLGEGINDAPALKIANVGLVVQSASDVSRENADIILLQKSLHTIIDGITQGRQVFVNTTKYLKSTLASNFGNFYAIAVSSLFVSYLPMLPLQILLVNLLSDFPMIAIATDTVDKSEINQPEKYDIRQVVILATVLGVISTIFDFMFFGLFYRSASGVLQTNWFIGSILTELIFIYSIRTRRPFWRSIRPSKIIIALTSIAAIITCVLPYIPQTQTVFKFTPPSSQHLFTIFGLVIAYFVCTEFAKLTYYKTSKNIR